MRSAIGLILAAFVLFGASSARAGSCAPGQTPFTDVPDGAIFCTDALWLRNALVTLGCGAGTTYCPGEPVSRAQMALFMRRLATAVKPDVVYADAATAAGDIDGAGYPTCISGVYHVEDAGGSNPRRLTHAIGSVSILTDAAADIFVLPQMSIDGGPFFTLGSAGSTSLARVPPASWTSVPVLAGATMLGSSGGVQLNPGSAYQWRILMQRQVGSPTTGEVTSNRCQLLVNVVVDSSG